MVPACSHSPIQPDGQNHAKQRAQAVLGEWERESEMWVALTSVLSSHFPPHAFMCMISVLAVFECKTLHENIISSLTPPITHISLGYLIALPAQTELITFPEPIPLGRNCLCHTCLGSVGTLSALGLVSCNGGGEQNPNHVLEPSCEFNKSSFTLTWWPFYPKALVLNNLWIFNSSLGPSTHSSPNTWSLVGGVGRALFSFPMVLQGCLSSIPCIWTPWASLGLWVAWEFQWERFIVAIKESCLTSQTLIMILSSISSWFKLYWNTFHREWISSTLLSYRILVNVSWDLKHIWKFISEEDTCLPHLLPD